MITRTFKSARGLVTLSFDPDADDSPILIDHASSLFLTVDEAHQFYSLFADFLAEARRVPHTPARSAPSLEEYEAARNIPNQHKEAPSHEEYVAAGGGLPYPQPGPEHNSVPPTRPEPG